MSRTQNATRNLFYGVALRIYQIMFPFVMRTAMIYLMGVEYLGLNSLFTSILQVLNLAELGVGSAMVFSMYKPIVDNDTEMICALLRLYKKYYAVIGLIIAVIGIILTPFIPKLIKGDIPGNLNIYVLYLLNLGATILTYWLFAYKNSLLQAHQRNDISSKVAIVSSSLQYILQLLVLWIFHDYYLYVIIALLTTAMNNVVIALVANRMYPQYKPCGNLPKQKVKEINQRIKDLFTAKLGATIVNSADTVVISAFLGLTVLAMYQNYYFIMSSIMGVLAIVFTACLAGVGNSMVTESTEKNYNDFRIITFLMNWIANVCVCCFATMYQPFISLWVGEQYVFDNQVVVLLCVYFYLVIIQQIIGLYKDAAGIWHQDRYRPLVASLVNLALNIVFVRYWGIYAIILSTILSYLIVAMPWMVINVFKYVFQRDWKKYVFDMISYFMIAAVIAILCSTCCIMTRFMNNILQLVINALVSLILSNALLFMIYRKNTYFSQMIELIDRILKYKYTRFFEKMKWVDSK